MRTTLVTGGVGFIGSNFVAKLFEQCPDERIVVLDVFTYAANPDNIPAHIRESTRFKLVKGDICDSRIVEELVSQADRVVHFAAESHVTRSIDDDVPFFETDVMGTQTIASAISRHASRIERFIHISTSEVYGTAEYAPMDEDHPLNPCTPYAAAKAGADRLVYAYRTTYKIPTVIIRPFNNYGPRQHLEKVIPRFITAALCDEPLTVHGDGRMTRDWIYVEDTCEAVFRALEADVVGEVVNVGTGVDTSVIIIAEALLDIMGKPRSLIEIVPPRPGQVDRHIAGNAKARVRLKWEPKVRLFEGLASAVRWYRDNPGWWERQRHTKEIKVVDRISGSVRAW